MVWSAKVTVPTRASAVLDAIATRTLALPTPELGAGELIQSALLRAVHWQPGVAVSATVKSACPEDASNLEGETENWHGADA
jgi:hypothetical protein